MQLYHKCRPSVTSPGLTILPKLKYEHISLTSFSKMRVDLAAQVRIWTNLNSTLNNYIHFYNYYRSSAIQLVRL